VTIRERYEKREGWDTHSVLHKDIGDLLELVGGKWFDKNGETKEFKGYYIVDPASPMPAVIDATKMRFIRPDLQAYLSFSELAAAQGYPTGYEFSGRNRSNYYGNGRGRTGKEAIARQLANSVPVELSAAISGALFEVVA